jgi:crotonobetainyl-CoA:carnitine CoA-transferase CaiB-like acyl-CoA transferase
MSNSPKAGAGPCAGLRVIEFATMVSGPYCGQMLADLGAEIIKLEPLEGDGLRAVRPEYKGLGTLFVHYNRGKKSMCVDLKSAQGAEVVRDLVRSADVVLENFRPGVMDRLGFGYEAFKALNPGLVYVSISGFGASGPYVDRPAYDQVIQGLTGYMWAQGENQSPQPVRNPVVDKISAVTAFHGTLAALLHRERGGSGQHVSVSLMDAYASFIMPGLVNNETFPDAGLEHYPMRQVFHPVKTQDGYVMGHVQTNAQFTGCAHAFGREDILDDPRFANPRERLKHIGEMWSEMAVGAATRTTEQIMSVALAHSVPLGPVQTVQQFMQDPQARHNQTFVDFQDPEYGVVRQMNFPARLEGSPANAQARAPRQGEHTDTILASLGRQAEEVAALKAARAVS